MLRFESHPWRDAFARYGGHWNELVEGCGLNPSLGPQWTDLSIRAHQLEDDSSVLIGTSGTAVRAVIPLLRRKQRILGVALRMLEMGSNLTAYHPAFVTDGLEAEVAERLLAGDAGARWDAFRFHAAVKSGRTLEALRAAAGKRGLYWVELPGERSPNMPIEQSWGDYLAGKSSNFRYNLQRKAKKFQKTSGARLQWVDADADFAAVMRWVLEIERDSWKAQQNVAINQNDAERRYYEHLLPMLARRGALAMNLLFVGDEPAAYTLCCHVNGWMGLLKTSFKLKFSEAAAGNYSMNEMVKRAFELGAREFDFLGGEDKYKLEWSPGVREHVDFLCFSRTARARWVAFLAKTRRRFA